MVNSGTATNNEAYCSELGAALASFETVAEATDAVQKVMALIEETRPDSAAAIKSGSLIQLGVSASPFTAESLFRQGTSALTPWVGSVDSLAATQDRAVYVPLVLDGDGNASAEKRDRKGAQLPTIFCGDYNLLHTLQLVFFRRRQGVLLPAEPG